LRLRILGLLINAALVIVCAQNPQTSTSTASAPQTNTAPPAPAPRPQFFAGTVTAITDDQIIVSRTIVGHQPDTRTFQITPKTKLNREICKPDAKVTVRYQRLPQGNVALQVLVHRESKPADKHL
jgi:hypothetical protein